MCEPLNPEQSYEVECQAIILIMDKFKDGINRFHCERLDRESG